MTAFLVIFAGFVGLCIGSFLTVVVDRLPEDRSIVTPGSRCPKCGAGLRWRDNVPVISWLALRGRCASCDQPIPVHYLLIEAATAALFVGAAVHFGYSWSLPPYLVLFAGLVGLAAIDVDRHLLPARIVRPLFVLIAVLLVVAAIATGEWNRLLTAAASALIWFSLFFAIYRSSPRLLGFGDVRLAAVLGLALGWLGATTAVIGFLLSNVLGLVVALGLLATGRINRETPIPYGVFLAAGTIVAVFIGPIVTQHLQNIR